MARAIIIVEKWSPVLGWQYDKGYPEDDEDLALLQAHLLEGVGVPARVYRRTPDGPEIIYESSREVSDYP
jgi:hypothetical protein